MRSRFPIFHLRQKSLARGTLLALASLWVSFRLSGFPEVHVSLWLILPLLAASAATWDTARCLRKRWSFYHGGVLLLLYCDLMILLMISFLLLAPFSSAIL
ncbi:MAG TPA: permease [Acidobacteriaceae bacterium]|nr:permease [Acidobacteriaceae bacterium]